MRRKFARFGKNGRGQYARPIAQDYINDRVRASRPLATDESDLSLNALRLSHPGGNLRAVSGLRRIITATI